MLVTLTERYFSDPQWIFERKLDGERCLGFRDGADAGLLSRTGQSLTDTYPEIAEALGGRDCDDFVVDGEIVAFEGTRTSFARLQQRIGIHDPCQARASRVVVTYYEELTQRLDSPVGDHTAGELQERLVDVVADLPADP
ncbi:hypothetical protein AB0I54_44210 [Streptomyces sp. NPDC050625]|uniref:ATP-dependent DNA ligase n=1 Tax=Streptomyces sp. NPDC050625 TaxID=3154629 RepID=UPI003447AF38